MVHMVPAQKSHSQIRVDLSNPEDMVEALLGQVWKKLGDLSGKAGDLVGKDLQGVLKGLGKKSPKAKEVIKELGRELERGLRDILRGR